MLSPPLQKCPRTCGEPKCMRRVEGEAQASSRGGQGNNGPHTQQDHGVRGPHNETEEVRPSGLLSAADQRVSLQCGSPPGWRSLPSGGRGLWALH